MTVFVTADIPVYECADPPIERLWRAAVRDDDLVYVITADADDDRIVARIEALPGRKRLVAGLLRLDQGFLLTPLPLDPGQVAAGEINLHGKPIRPLSADPRRRCVSLELTGFRPLRLDAIRSSERRPQAAADPPDVEPEAAGKRMFQAAE